MTTRRNAPWAELLQLVPILSLAAPFIVEGSVDLARAADALLLAALLTLPVTALVLFAGQLLNPILVGTALWLWLGALAFQIPVQPLAEWLIRTQAFGLFVAVLGVGVWTTLLSRYGYVACRHEHRLWVRRASFGLLALTAGLTVWAWLFRADIRVGGGVPFILLNVARRLICLRGPHVE